MREDWYPGIREFCNYWSHAPMLHQTLESLEIQFREENDGCIDASKGLVECACRILIQQLDDPSDPIRKRMNSPLKSKNPGFRDWISATFQLLDLTTGKDDPFSKIISEHYKMTDALCEFRNRSGPLSHGKDGFSRRLTSHHRRSALLAADALVTFLHQAYLERTPDPVTTMEPYEKFKKSNEKIDYASFFEKADISDEGILEVDIEIGDYERISLNITVSELLFGVDREAYKLAQNKTDSVEIITNEIDE